MYRCFELAEKGNNKVKNNPFVGSVIVYKDRIIGEGWHQKFGFEHAEVNAFKSVADEDKGYLKDSTLYVNLEPCFHFGSTPPCVNLIIKNKIKRVVISNIDPHVKVQGKSIQKMKDLGIEVETGILKNKGKKIARRFITLQKKERPYIILKYAESDDGFIGKNNEQVWLTNQVSKRLVHKWRANESAIMVGTNTVEIDNPNLTTRLVPGENPIRIILDLNNRLSKDLNVFNADAKTVIISSKKGKIKNVEYIVVEKRFEISSVLKKLIPYKIKSLIVEGGAQLLQSFIDQNVWDEARVFISPVQLKDGILSPKLHNQFLDQNIKVGTDQLKIYFNKENIFWT